MIVLSSKNENEAGDKERAGVGDIAEKELPSMVLIWYKDCLACLLTVHLRVLDLMTTVTVKGTKRCA